MGINSSSSVISKGKITSNNARLGAWSMGSSWARFGHKDFDGGIDFGYLQNSSGDIYIAGHTNIITSAVETEMQGQFRFLNKVIVAQAPVSPTDVVRLTDLSAYSPVASNIAIANSNYTVASGVDLVICETSSAFDVTLLPASSMTGKKITIKNISGSTVTVKTNAGELTIRNASGNVNALSLAGTSYGTGLVLISNGTSYYTIP